MEKKITLPSGATVVLRDFNELRVKDRNKIFITANAKNDFEQALSITDGLIACIVKEWSFDLIPPAINIESLGELSIPDYDYLSEYALEAQKVLFPTLQKTLENEADPKVITANSNV